MRQQRALGRRPSAHDLLPWPWNPGSCTPVCAAIPSPGRAAGFPNIPAPNGSNGPEFSECARNVLAAKPKKGNAVLFHSIKPNGELERRSMHTAWCVPLGCRAARAEGPPPAQQCIASSQRAACAPPPAARSSRARSGRRPSGCTWGATPPTTSAQRRSTRSRRCAVGRAGVAPGNLGFNSARSPLFEFQLSRAEPPSADPPPPPTLQMDQLFPECKDKEAACESWAGSGALLVLRERAPAPRAPASGRGQRACPVAPLVRVGALSSVCTAAAAPPRQASASRMWST